MRIVWNYIKQKLIRIYQRRLLPSYTVLKNTIQYYQRDKVHRMGAALSYYTIFSLPAIIIIIIGLVGFFLGDAAVRGEIYGFLEKDIFSDNKNVAAQIENAVRNIGTTSTNWWATVLGIGFLIFVATNIFYAIQEALNSIFQVEEVPSKVKILQIVINRFLSFGMILSIGLLLIISILANALLLTVTDFILNQKEALASGLPDGLDFIVPYLDYFTSYFFVFLNLGVSIFLIACFFAALYKILPAVKLAWRHIIYGALFSAVLFWIGELVIGIYLSKAGVISAYGAAGSLIVLLIWVYYSSQLVFLGAEFIKAYCNYKEIPIEPKVFAKRLQNFKTKKHRKTVVEERSSEVENEQVIIQEDLEEESNQAKDNVE
ncbi:MAG: YihY/virulence factor BrkB family protein [Saprospiraceae bacterium]|nr:YihY/virulence factor BrkB family protein [Saprospiraceae bacterium]